MEAKIGSFCRLLPEDFICMTIGSLIHPRGTFSMHHCCSSLLSLYCSAYGCFANYPAHKRHTPVYRAKVPKSLKITEFMINFESRLYSIMLWNFMRPKPPKSPIVPAVLSYSLFSSTIGCVLALIPLIGFVQPQKQLLLQSLRLNYKLTFKNPNWGLQGLWLFDLSNLWRYLSTSWSKHQTCALIRDSQQ